MLGSLLVGYGVVGRVHANALAELAARGDGHLVGVVDKDPSRIAAAERDWGIPATTQLAEALTWPGVDLVHICTPSGVHADPAIQAALAGKHVLVEKPIDITLPAADRLIEACERASVLLGVVSQHRFDRGFLQVESLVRQGAFGPLVLGEARVKWYRSQTYYDSAGWRGTWEMDGGGALINQSIHYIDLLLALCGPVRSVAAHTATTAHTIEVEDVAAASLRFANGAVGTILGSTAIYPGLSERLEISGRTGTAIIDDGELVYLATQSALGDVGHHGQPWAGQHFTPQHVAPHAPPYGGQHTNQIADMLRAIRDGQRPTVTGQDGRRALCVVLAIYESARSGNIVLLR